QNPHSARRLLAEVLGIPAAQLRVRTNDVGGSFGLKGRYYPEDVLVLWAARVTGRPVKWRCDRSEGFVADFHGRDQEAEGRIAMDADGRILALDVVTRHNLGARLGPATGVSPNLTPRMLCGPYLIPAARIQAQAVFTHLRPTTSYRGAGRPEATYFIERLLDRAAQVIGIDPVEIRRRNLIPAEAMPYRTAMGDEYDCGNLPACLDRAIELADLPGLVVRRENSAERGRMRGWGIATFIEVASISNERMEVRFDPSGKATIVAGTCAHGQGHETVFRQMAGEWLGLPLGEIGFRQGDTDIVSYGGGTYASRSITAGGSALQVACEGIIARAKRIAAWKLGCTEEDLDFASGHFARRNANESITLEDVAKAAYATFGFPAEFGAGLEAVGYYQTERPNYPNGCHIVELEIDRETGEISVDRYVAVDDVGRVVNPLLLEGQLHGSIMQGLGAALQERIQHDAEGQLLTAAFTEYAMPRAAHAPRTIIADHANIPTSTNPLGVKGGAEVGTIGAPPAIASAVNDALGLTGESVIEMPFDQATILKILKNQKGCLA
ncbi:MAG: molybdopterin cofactor-binding domain-containing protein, partial [Novosphingobium sp.]